MKWKTLQIFVMLALVIVVTADDYDDIDIPDDLSLEDIDEDLLRELEEKQVKSDMNRENEIASKIASNHMSNNIMRSPVADHDPCEKMHCGAGRVCKSKDDTAECVCISDCPTENDPRRQVCTNKNETWSSDCHVYREKCLCDTKNVDCKNPRHKHIHIDYYGACKQLPDCTDEEMNDFPRRMRDWLFNVMRDLAERDELNEYYLQMELEAETNLTRRWSNAAVWKWCDLDGDTDRSVSRHELFPIRAPLMSLEHCIAPFLHSCDNNKDHRISLKEWGNCLELDESEMYERCDTIQKAQPHLG